MPNVVPVNPDLPSSYLNPGIYLKLNLAGTGAAIGSTLKRLLVWGYKLATGTLGTDQPLQVFQQSDVNTFAGQGSDLARAYNAAISHGIAGLADVFILPITEPSAGVQATHLVTFAGTATAPGFFDIFICGYKHSIPIPNGDTATVIGSNVRAAINLNKDLPVTASSSTGIVTLTYRHKGVVGNDLPRIGNLNGATGITVSPGTVTISGTAAAGTITLSIGGTTI